MRLKPLSSGLKIRGVAPLFIRERTGTNVGRKKTVKSILGRLRLSEKQSVILDFQPYQRISPYLTECCLRASANVSYENAAQDIERYTGIKVSGKTQQRLVHRYQFKDFECQLKVSEISVDGGKVRFEDRKPKERLAEERDYKAVCIHPQSRMAWFQENEQLLEWVNHQSFDTVLNCVGDGHPGIWNLMNQFNRGGETRQILDWFHLVENLGKVGGSLKRIAQGKQLLWQGKVDETRGQSPPVVEDDDLSHSALRFVFTFEEESSAEFLYLFTKSPSSDCQLRLLSD